MGRQLLQLANRWDAKLEMDRLLHELVTAKSPGMLSTIYAWITHHWNISLNEALHGFLYNAASMSIQAGIRLISMGQMEGQTMLYNLQPAIAETVLSVCQPTTCPQPRSYAWMQDADAMAHEELYSRLFMS